MLVVSNGAVKSGSTWLFNILTSLREFAWPDSSFLTKSNAKHPTVAPGSLAQYLAGGSFNHRDEITKNHLDKPEHRELLLSVPAVRVICMTRDSRDVIVSAYYHGLLAHQVDCSFDDFYWDEGRMLLPKLARYQATWAEPHTQMEFTSFEALKSDFHAEAARLAKLLEVPIDDDGLERIREQTSLDSLREKYQDAPSHRTAEADFFRKGETGDWRNHFTDKMLADHDRICSKGISSLDRHLLVARAKRKIRRVLA
jgi:Sulfotransferase domain